MSFRMLMTMVFVLGAAMLLMSTKTLVGKRTAPAATTAPADTATVAAPAPGAPAPAAAAAPDVPPGRRGTGIAPGARSSLPAQRATGAASSSRSVAAPARAANPDAPADTAPPLPRAGNLYRWRDASGRIHYNTEAPPPSVAVQIIPFERSQPDAPPAPATREETTAAEGPAPAYPDNPLTVYTPEGLEDLFDQVEQTAERLYQRHKELDSLKEQL